MCNGTGSVRVRPRRIDPVKILVDSLEQEILVDSLEQEILVDSLEQDHRKRVRTNNQDLFNVSEIPYQVYSRLNKNEFEVFYKGIIKHLASCDFRRAAASFNYLMELTIGSEQESELKLHFELLNIKKNLLDEIVEAYQNKEVIHISSRRYSDKISELEKNFQGVYKKYFGN